MTATEACREVARLLVDFTASKHEFLTAAHDLEVVAETAPGGLTAKIAAVSANTLVAGRALGAIDFLDAQGALDASVSNLARNCAVAGVRFR